MTINNPFIVDYKQTNTPEQAVYTSQINNVNPTSIIPDEDSSGSSSSESSMGSLYNRERISDLPPSYDVVKNQVCQNQHTINMENIENNTPLQVLPKKQ